MHIVVFYYRYATSWAEIYYYTGTSLYRELLAKLKAAKAVIDWFMQIDFLLYLLLVKKLAKAKRGG